jgi:hypothetical protein
MQPSKQNMFKVVIFIFFFCLIFNQVSIILQKKWPERTATEIRFHSEPKNSIDVLFVGSSSFYRGVSPLVLWNQYGFTSYVLANSNQSPLALYDSVEDALKTQNLKLVVVDGIVLVRDFVYSKYEAHVRKYIDPIPFSLRKLKLIYAFWQQDHELSLISMLFPAFRYHDRWSELSNTDYIPFDLNTELDTKGQTNIYYYIPLKYPPGYMKTSTSQLPIQEKSKIYYDRIIDLCNQRKVKVIFVTYPRMNWTYDSYNALKTYTESKQVPYFDFSFPSEISKVGLDLSIDFLDFNHLNNLGAQKMSIALGEKIIQLDSLPDHRNDPNYSTWNSSYSIYKKEALDPSMLIMDVEKMKEIEKQIGDEYIQLEE